MTADCRDVKPDFETGESSNGGTNNKTYLLKRCISVRNCNPQLFFSCFPSLPPFGWMDQGVKVKIVTPAVPSPSYKRRLWIPDPRLETPFCWFSPVVGHASECASPFVVFCHAYSIDLKRRPNSINLTSIHISEVHDIKYNL